MLDRETCLRLGAGATDIDRAGARIVRQARRDTGDAVERIGIPFVRPAFEGGDARTGSTSGR